MLKHVLATASFLALASIVSPVFAADTCEAALDRLNDSKAEGPDRLLEKEQAADVCDKEHKKDKAIAALVKQCAKYEEQAVAKQQAVADCQLAAYNFANNLRNLKRDYRK